MIEDPTPTSSLKQFAAARQKFITSVTNFPTMFFAPFRSITRPLSIINIHLRGLKAVAAKRYSGTIEDIIKQEGAEVGKCVKGAVEQVEQMVPEVASYGMRGTKFHKSTTDPEEMQDVLSMRLFSDLEGSKEAYLFTMHIRKDGSWKSNRKELFSNE